MARGFHVNGPALIKVGTGDAAALEELGLTEDGVNVRPVIFQEPVKCDSAGPAVPADMQYLGAEATITGRLTNWDEAVLAKCRMRSMGMNPSGELADGQLDNIGALIGTGGFAIKLVIASRDLPWRFFTCVLREPQNSKLSMKYTPHEFHFYAWGFVSGDKRYPQGVKLYDRVDA